MVLLPLLNGLYQEYTKFVVSNPFLYLLNHPNDIFLDIE